MAVVKQEAMHRGKRGGGSGPGWWGKGKQKANPRALLLIAPLLFARNSIKIAVHLCPGTIVEKKFGFFA